MQTTAHAELRATTPVSSKERHSLADITVGLAVIGIVIVIAVKSVIALYQTVTGTSPPPKAAGAPPASSLTRAPAKAPSGPTVEQACAGARFTPCFVNEDGKTCRNDMANPIAQLVANGSYAVSARTVNDAGICTLTLSVNGSLNGNSYARTVQVWAHK